MVDDDDGMFALPALTADAAVSASVGSWQPAGWQVVTDWQATGAGGHHDGTQNAHPPTNTNAYQTTTAMPSSTGIFFCDIDSALLGRPQQVHRATTCLLAKLAGMYLLHTDCTEVHTGPNENGNNGKWENRNMGFGLGAGCRRNNARRRRTSYMPATLLHSRPSAWHERTRFPSLPYSGTEQGSLLEALFSVYHARPCTRGIEHRSL
ncbi:hypothetical protein E4U56_002787 [Claviceps arundinis]|uniref:Uncharacterized protein n=1 Tax=Claviceps arundinis TaxID=1623583 RepID=A0A9P7MQH2_9HYPO|nr:hypothetical protein E4U56_002787 [Claviceps arundinis]